MLCAKRLRKNIVLIIPVLFLIMIFPGPIQTSAEFSLAGDEAPALKTAVQDDLQPDIRELCENNNLAYTLVLAIYQIDLEHNVQISDMDQAITELAYYRDYWAEQGYSDEMVFDLILLSRQRGIDGCRLFTASSASLDDDQYIQEVTRYKYYLDQIDLK